MSKIAKAELKALEQLFAAEIEGLLPFQSRAKIFKSVEEYGWAEQYQVVMGTGLSRCRVSGYRLTEAGRLLYCSTCSENSPTTVDGNV